MSCLRRVARPALAILALLGLATAPLFGWQNGARSDGRRGPVDSTEVEAFIDGVMAAHLPATHVAGATVSIVRDGKLLFAKGYGYADVAGRRPVDPARTMFRIGSISKLFTWTAVMQLVDEGKLDLDRDVNEYLDFRIPDTYPEPITLRHFLTHTPGLEEDGRDLFTEDSTHMKPMSEWLPRHMPARVRPPGQFSSYSNWGTAVAGYIVERVSGLSYDEFLEQRIFGPLGMAQTTARQPLPGRFADDMSNGYAWENGAFVAKKWEIVTGAAPAGSMSASATDMARWMLVHLGRGELDGVRILSEAAAGQMHTRSYTHDPRLNGFGLGFYEKSSRGVRIIGHGGDTRWFHSDMAILPEEQLGIFVSYNTNTGGELSFGPFLRTVLDHYYPAEVPAPVAHGDLSRFSGNYLFNRTSYTTFQKAMGLAGNVPVRALADSVLLVSTPFGASQMIPVDSMLFQDRVTGMRVAFRADESGRVTHAFVNEAPMMALERQPWYTSPRLHMVVLGGSLVVFAAFLIAAVARWFRRRRGVEPDAPPALGSGRRALAIAALANLVFIVGLAGLASGESLFSDAPTGLRIVLALPVLAVLLVLAAGWYAWRLWRGGEGTRWERWRFTGVVVAGLLFAWSLNTWNLLGWRM